MHTAPHDKGIRQGILFVNPPVGDTRGPYLAIPQLAGYLQSRAIPVYARDLSAAFYKRLLTPSAIARGAAYVHERFRKLNAAPILNYPQLMEYSFLVRLLADYPRHRGDIRFLTTPFADFDDIRESGIADYLLLMASMPAYPEILVTARQFMNPSRYYPFSSKEIIRSIHGETAFRPIFQDLADQLVQDFAPRIIGFSVYFGHQVIPAFQIAAMLRAKDPGVHITMGGPAISIYFREVKNPDLFQWVDSLIIDDGEIPLERMYQRLASPMAKREDIQDIPGVITVKNGQIVKTAPDPPPILTELPAPDFTVLDLDTYFQTREEMVIPLRISRGCTWQKCAFCRTSHPLCKETQTPDNEFVFDHLEQLYENQGIRRFFFCAESADPGMLAFISKRLIEKKMDVSWLSHTRVSRDLTAEMGSLYAQSGCKSLAVGVEAMSDRILSLMRKGITTRLIDSVFNDIGKTLPLNLYMMVGFPTETRAEALESYERVKALKEKGLVRSMFYTLFTLQQDSEIMQHPENFGISSLDISPDADLSPDIVGFEGEGMSREEAFGLYLQFFKQQSYGKSEAGTIDTIQLSGKKTEVRFDLTQVRRLSVDQWRVMVMPFAKWVMEYADKDITIQPRSSSLSEQGHT